MRLILFFLLLSLGADAQIIRANAFYRPTATQFLLDAYPNAAVAYSLRKLDKDYTGSAIRVRRKSDNAEQDVGFVGQNLDTASLKTFVGISLSDTGWITTWYDQMSLKNVTQSVSVNQPMIIAAGNLTKFNNKVSISFDGVNDRFGASDTLLPTGSASYISVHYSNDASLTNGQYRCIFNYAKAVLNQAVFNTYGDDANFGNDGFGISQFGNATGIANRLQKNNLSFVIKPASTGTWNLWINNTLSASKSMNTTTILSNIANSFTIGSYNAATGISSFLNGYISELIIYPSNQSSNRTGIETNINSYYGLW